jgi:excisionase family DNA binding protein
LIADYAARHARKHALNGGPSSTTKDGFMSHNTPHASSGEKRAYRINEAVAAYRLSRSTIYKLIAAGTLHTVKIGGRRLIPRDALEALLNEDAQ